MSKPAVERLDAVSRSLGVTRSALVREAVRRLLNELERSEAPVGGYVIRDRGSGIEVRYVRL